MAEENELTSYIRNFFGVTPEEVAKIISYFELVELRKGDYFLRKGQLSNRLGFVQSGIIREYLTIEGKEITKWISTKGYFVVDLASFTFEKPSRWNIHALTDCSLHVIRQENYRDINKLVPHWEHLEKLFIARCFGLLEDRIVSHLAMTAEERYQQLLQTNKELFNQVPLQYIATMLGMTPETLSRFRKKASQG